jgi:two-component system sensor histidine kinase KdpD
LDEFSRRHPQTSLRVQIQPDLPPVETTAATVDQVLWNLLTNAQKYGPSEGPIEVAAQHLGEEVTVTVRDCGAGVPEAEVADLFGPYFRSSSTADHAPGLGLGLSVCKVLVESQGGRVWAKRRTPNGMEFGFALPISAG